jgi:hypothetical protein
MCRACHAPFAEIFGSAQTQLLRIRRTRSHRNSQEVIPPLRGFSMVLRAESAMLKNSPQILKLGGLFGSVERYNRVIKMWLYTVKLSNSFWTSAFYIPSIRPFCGSNIYEPRDEMLDPPFRVPRGLRHEPFRQLEHWDYGFESYSRHGCMCAFILCLYCSVCR